MSSLNERNTHKSKTTITAFRNTKTEHNATIVQKKAMSFTTALVDNVKNTFNHY
jgi:hypothetical protein